MKQLLTLLCCVAALTWSGCSKDDDDNTVDLSQLIGTWELTREYDGEDNYWDEEWGAEFGYISTVEFRNDGTATTHYEEVGFYTSDRQYTYTVESNILTMTDTTDPDDTETIRIQKLTASELILVYDYEGENGKPCTDQEFYKRIN